LLIIAFLLAFIVGRATLFFDGSFIAALSAAGAVAVITMAFRKRPAVETKTVRRSRVATLLSHTGVAIFALAATLNHVFGVEADQQVAIGESFEAGPYTIALNAIDEVQGPNYIGALARVVVDDKLDLTPEFRYYPVRDVPTTEADIDTNLLRDLRVTLNLVDTSDPEELVWALRFHRRPAMVWLWIATLITSLGLMLSAISAFRET
jgi:cytochrome c-type biogenesis protein CcmF